MTAITERAPAPDAALPMADGIKVQEPMAVPAAQRVGFWSGLLAAVWAVWFIVAFAPWMAGLGEWQGIDAYAARFESLPYLAWVVPCLLLALTFPILLAAVHISTPPRRRVWSLIGLLFGAMYGGVLATNYWLLASVVRVALEDRHTDGLAWLVIGSPHTITGALEGVGYAFMGIASLFVGFAFAGSRLASWTRWLFVANGIGGLIGFVAFGAGDILPGSFMIIGWLGLGIWNVTFPVATVFAALNLRREVPADVRSARAGVDLDRPRASLQSSVLRRSWSKRQGGL
jgi:hypothetical protein